MVKCNRFEYMVASHCRCIGKDVCSLSKGLHRSFFFCVGGWGSMLLFFCLCAERGCVGGGAFEPYLRSLPGALHKQSGIVNYNSLCERFSKTKDGLRSGLRLRGGEAIPQSIRNFEESISTAGSPISSVTIRKPDIDKRQYRYLKLENGLEAIVVSDSETHSAAAALCVAVGQLDDPPEVQGLAHFCEHMVFLGTERFPEESNFDQFCASCAGYSNAWTSLDHTLYHFIVAHNKLHEALDRFSAFFSCPLFSESGTEREMNAVDSENNKNLQDDSRREHQLMRCMSDPSHPISRFGAGSYKTLHDLPAAAGVDVRAALLAFHRTHYTADAMRLAVVGREPLDDLERFVRTLFGAIPPSRAPRPRPWVPRSCFAGGRWRRQVAVVPVKERRKLKLSFPCPPVHSEYRTKPLCLLSQVIGHEGPGSLLACVRDLGWATELSAGPATLLPSESVFAVTMTLTEEGVPRWGEAVRAVFALVHRVRGRGAAGARARLRGEAARMQELNFRFRSKEREDAHTEALAYNLHLYPPAHALCGPELYFDPYDAALDARVEQLLDRYFRPDNLRLELVCPEAEIPASFVGAYSPAAAAAAADAPAGGGDGDPPGAPSSAAGGAFSAAGEEGRADEASGGGVGGAGGAPAAAGMSAAADWQTEEWYGIRYLDKPLDPALAALCAAPPRAEDWAAFPEVLDMDLPPPNKYIPDGDFAAAAGRGGPAAAEEAGGGRAAAAALLPAAAKPAPTVPADAAAAADAAAKVMGKDEPTEVSAAGPAGTAGNLAAAADGGGAGAPVLMVSEAGLEVWHGRDVSFEQPKVLVCVQLDSPLADSSARAAALLRLLLETLELAVNEERYMAEEGGLSLDLTNYCFSSPCRGLRLQVFGYRSRLPLLLKDVLGHFKPPPPAAPAGEAGSADGGRQDAMEGSGTQEGVAEGGVGKIGGERDGEGGEDQWGKWVTPAVFEMAKEKVVTDYRNRRFQQPYCHGLIVTHAALESPFYSNDERCAAAEAATLADLAAFRDEYLNSLSVKALVAGDAGPAEAAAVVDILRPLVAPPRRAAAGDGSGDRPSAGAAAAGRAHAAPAPAAAASAAPAAQPAAARAVAGPAAVAEDGLVPLRIARLEEGAVYRHWQAGPDPDHGDSAVVVYMQSGPRSHAQDATLELLVQMMDREAYAQLRTREQLGYIVSVEAHARWGVAGVRLAVQSARSPAEVEARVDAFLEAFRAQLAAAPPAEVAEHAAALALKKREPDRTLEAAGVRAFHEVVARTRAFDRRAREAAALAAVRREDLVALLDACRRRRLVAHVVGRAALAAGAVDPPPGPDAAAEIRIVRAGVGAASAAAPAAEERVVSLKEFASTVERYWEQL